MARLRKFDQYAADFLRELQDLLGRYCKDMEAAHPGDEIHCGIIRFTLKSGEDVHAFYDHGHVNFLYRGKFYPNTDLPHHDTDNVSGSG